ncbi:RNA polymerase I-specific transcription initiation factor Rrn7 [Lepidopterella palustris CBS 459.81]|uniref:RNA polymerase I-specific transcription initiation factor Rrn7 n=1 Tax=Lepidopterella palustris CBS 459.81 TaxID=1314670 RepID=A0A8E2EGF1_9PEZI|nr:RNA polymerase I-specific transcription initiation factor Rrn7 [Lepidopterella palustris CBS 459.81]
MAPREKGTICGIENCRSRYYEQGDDGYQYCQEGHRRGNVLTTGQDEDDFNPYAKKQRQKSTEEREKKYQYFKGREAFDLYLKCYQLILRHQIWFLIRLKGLPAELESVIFDLWALRVMNLKDRVDDASGDESQSQVFSTSESEMDTEDEAPTLSRRGRKTSDTPKLIDTLALCYLGSLTLRLPLTLGDLHAWATRGDMVYSRAIKLIPISMKERLPSNYHSSLEPTHVLKPERLHSAVLDLAVAYEKVNGISFPPINHPLLLFRYIKKLALPLEVYASVTKLARLLNYTFAFPADFTKRLRNTDIPDVQLVSLIVISVKLIYPFDDICRYPASASEPAAIMMDWDAWEKATGDFKMATEVPGKLKAEELMELQEKDVFLMSGDQLDQYLNWYRDTWVDETVRGNDADSDFRNALFKEFPIGTTNKTEPDSTLEADNAANQKAETQKLMAVHSAMKPKKVIAEEDADGDIQRPGSRYKRYREVIELPDKAKMFYEEAARISGLSMKMLVNAVFSVEQRIERRGQRKRKEERSHRETS